MKETEGTDSATADAYVYGAASVRPAPVGLWARLKYLGPAVIISGSIVGSGELILTSSLGAAAGFVLFWWVILACASKSIVQAELTRYVIVSGDTYLRALNRLPGTLPGPDGPVAWPIWLQLLMFFPSAIGIGGIMGGAGEALSLLVPVINPVWGTVAVTVATILILTFGNYGRLELLMMILVGVFTIVTIVSAISLQFTPMAMDGNDVATALSFDFPIEHLALALAVYGFTGVNAGEIGPYTYWCVEKGYPAYIGPDSSDRDWLERARGWIRVVQMDVLLTLLIVICATIPFYILGAGVLHAAGRMPEGLNVVSVLSGMFTDTLGPWAYWLFVIGAFSILFSTAIAGVAGGSR
ncbi:MAG: Nramp family divalent metal transporter, partial [Myxococcota bacterium]